MLPKLLAEKPAIKPKRFRLPNTSIRPIRSEVALANRPDNRGVIFHLLVDWFKVGSLVKRLITPPMAPLPYCIDPGPRKTSIRSRLSGEIVARYWLGPERKVELFNLTPSI